MGEIYGCKRATPCSPALQHEITQKLNSATKFFAILKDLILKDAKLLPVPEHPALPQTMRS